ncbi:unnamed protein product [Arctogadus glacialis]
MHAVHNPVPCIPSNRASNEKVKPCGTRPSSILINTLIVWTWCGCHRIPLVPFTVKCGGVTPRRGTSPRTSTDSSDTRQSPDGQRKSQTISEHLMQPISSSRGGT